MGTYLGNDSLSCAVVFKEEVVGLYVKLASVLLFRCCPLFPQNDRTVRALFLRHAVYSLYKKNAIAVRMRQKVDRVDRTKRG